MFSLSEVQVNKVLDALEEQKLALERSQRICMELEKLLRVRLNLDGSMRLEA